MGLETFLFQKRPEVNTMTVYCAKTFHRGHVLKPETTKQNGRNETTETTETSEMTETSKNK